MSQTDVDLVRRLNLTPGVDWAEVVRDEERIAALQEQARPYFDDSFECGLVGVSEMWRPGLEGLRRIWLDWLEPWATYRTEEEETRDLGDGRVLYLGRDFGGRRDGLGEVELLSSAIWTVRDGKVTRIVFYATRDAALEAAGAP